MTGMTSARWAAISGIIFAVVFIAATIGLSGQIWNDMTDQEYLDIYEDSTERAVIIAIGFVALLATALLGIFLGHLLRRLRSAEGGEAPLTQLAQLAAAVLVTTWVVGLIAQVNVAAAITFGDYETPNRDTAIYFSQFGTGLVVVGTLFAASAVMGLTAAIAFRTGVFPRWLAWLSVVTGVACLFSASFLDFVAIAFSIWLLAFGVHLLRRGRDLAMAQQG